MLPITKVVASTGISVPFIPDIMQNPFNIAIGVYVASTAAASAVVAIEHTFDFSTVMSPSFNGLTAVVNGAVSTAIWFQNSAFTGSGGTTVSTTGVSGNYAFPVAAIRLNVGSSIAALNTVANFIQSVNSP